MASIEWVHVISWFKNGRDETKTDVCVIHPMDHPITILALIGQLRPRCVIETSAFGRDLKGGHWAKVRSCHGVPIWVKGGDAFA
jgi:hypothetical protein